MPISVDTLYARKLEILTSEAENSNIELILPRDARKSDQKTPETVLSEVLLASIVLADLSLERASCYFEVGLAQGVGKQTKLIAEKGTDIHQVFGRDSVVFYDGLDEYRMVVANALSS